MFLYFFYNVINLNQSNFMLFLLLGKSKLICWSEGPTDSILSENINITKQ